MVGMEKCKKDITLRVQTLDLGQEVSAKISYTEILDLSVNYDGAEIAVYF